MPALEDLKVSIRAQISRKYAATPIGTRIDECPVDPIQYFSRGVRGLILGNMRRGPRLLPRGPSAARGLS